MILQAIPLETSFTCEPLTYVMDVALLGDVRIGSLVSIPLQNREIHGIVCAFGEHDAPEGLKSVLRIECGSLILSECQIHVILSLARRYLMPLHRVATAFLPVSTLKRIDSGSFPELPSEPDRIAESGSSKLLHLSEGADMLEVVSRYCIEPGSAVVFPDDHFIEVFRSRYGTRDTVAYQTDRLTPVKRHRFYMEALSGKKENLI